MLDRLDGEAEILERLLEDARRSGLDGLVAIACKPRRERARTCSELVIERNRAGADELQSLDERAHFVVADLMLVVLLEELRRFGLVAFGGSAPARLKRDEPPQLEGKRLGTNVTGTARELTNDRLELRREHRCSTERLEQASDLGAPRCCGGGRLLLVARRGVGIEQGVERGGCDERVERRSSKRGGACSRKRVGRAGKCIAHPGELGFERRRVAIKIGAGRRCGWHRNGDDKRRIERRRQRVDNRPKPLETRLEGGDPIGSAALRGGLVAAPCRCARAACHRILDCSLTCVGKARTDITGRFERRRRAEQGASQQQVFKRDGAAHGVVRKGEPADAIGGATAGRPHPSRSAITGDRLAGDSLAMSRTKRPEDQFG